jgi:hypothetical protein
MQCSYRAGAAPVAPVAPFALKGLDRFKASED